MKNVSASVVVLVLIASGLAIPIPATTPTKHECSPIFSFGCMLEIQLTEEGQRILQNASFSPDGPPVNIPFLVRWKAAIPPALLRGPFRLMKHLFLFGTMYTPSEAIVLSIENPPSWASISISPSTAWVDIANDWNQANFIVSIACHHDAPPEQYTLTIRAESQALRTISSVETVFDLMFMPTWEPPLLDIYALPWSQTTPPGVDTDVTFCVTDLGTSRATITVTSTNLSGWTLDPQPAQFNIDPYQTRHVTLHIVPPGNFTGTETLHLFFTPSYNEETGPSIPFDLYVHYP